jgi:hypothetical protein
MRALSQSDVLRLWELGAEQPPARRALLLLDASAEDPDTQLAQWSIGWRDRRLLELRRALFGEDLAARVRCPSCGAAAELSFTASEILAPSPESPPDTVSVEAEGYLLSARLPNSVDLLELESAPPAERDAQALLRRCLLDARRADVPVGADELPAAALDALEREMSAADPQAECYLDISCPACGHRWQPPFDASWFLWSEIDAWARGVLGEVHALARAYGWSEREILSLGRRRRHSYLELVGA